MSKQKPEPRSPMASVTIHLIPALSAERTFCGRKVYDPDQSSELAATNEIKAATCLVCRGMYIRWVHEKSYLYRGCLVSPRIRKGVTR